MNYLAQFDWVFWLIAFLVACAIVTYLIKRRFGKNAKTWHIVSMVKTKRFLPLLDRYAKAGKVIEFVADAGIIIGFGLIGANFVFSRRTKDLKTRCLWLVITAIVLAGVFWLSFGGFFQSIMLKGQEAVFIAGFVLFGFAGFAILSLLYQGADIIIKLLAGKKACPGVAPLIPGVSIPNVPITAPLHAWISLFLILVIHEGMHGIVARKAKIAIKSAGILLLGFLPIGAFVEPKESQLRRAPKETAMRIYASGPGANFFTYIAGSIVFILLFAAIAPFYNPWSEEVKEKTVLGVQIASVDKNTSFCGDTFPAPAYGVLEKGMIVKEINGKKTPTLASVQSQLSKAKAKDLNFLVLSGSGELVEKHLKQNEMGKIGVTFEEKQNPAEKEPLDYSIATAIIMLLQSFLTWFLLLNLLVAIVNFLPMEPFDGGKMAKIVFVPFLSFWKADKKAKEKAIEKFFLWAILLILAINALPLFL